MSLLNVCREFVESLPGVCRMFAIRSWEFVLSLSKVCQQFVEHGYETQLGRVARTITPTGVESRLINSADELIDRLKATFRLDIPEVARLWPRIVDRHDKVFTKLKKRT